MEGNLREWNLVELALFDDMEGLPKDIYRLERGFLRQPLIRSITTPLIK